jgi:hypothetical protein
VTAVLQDFTVDTFRPLVGRAFRVIVDERQYMPAELIEVTPWGDTSDGKRQPFTLTFRADPGHRIPQATYTADTEGMEPFPLFLVPVKPEADGTRYEAVFS